MNDNLNIAAVLPWSEPVQKKTSRGMRHLCKAAPDASFWGLWRSRRDDLKAAGISPDKRRDGSWEICWWSDSPQDLSPKQTFVPMIAPVEQVQVAPKDSVNWSAEQTAIFGYFSSGTGNLIVQARAGTGKTTTIKEAFNHAPEAQMLYAVFNKRNQKEAERKISNPRVEVRTLHSVGFSIIQSVWAGVRPDEEAELYRISEACPGIPDEVVGPVKKLVAFAKNTTINPSLEEINDIADAREIEAPGFESAGYSVSRLAEIALKVLELSRVRDPLNRISFNDMVWLPVAMNWVRPRFDLVCVDEAQDMSLPQLTMVRLLSRGRVCVVGDDRQAIYGFRGAVQDGMKMMQEKLGASVLGLTTTYRCPKSVVALAAALVPDYKAAPEAPEGTVTALSDDHLIEGLEVGDAVLSRLNAPLMPFCLRLLRRGVAARIEGRDIGQQLLGIVRKLRARSVPDFIRRIENWGEKQIQRASKSKHVAAKTEQANDQVLTLVAVAEGCASVSEIESRLITLFQDSDSNPKPAVIFSSVHKAKGMEWERVFLLRDTFNRKVADQAQAQEEANIYYVALTRAKKHLVLVSKN